MYLKIGVAYPTGELFQGSLLTHIREQIVAVLAILSLHIFEMDATLIDTNRSTRLHASRANAMTCDALRKVRYCRLSNTSTRYHSSSDVHQSVQKSTSGHDDTPGSQFTAPDGLYTHHLFYMLLCHNNIFYQQLISLVLPDIQVGRFIKHGAPFPNKFASVALGSRTPNGRSFRTVQHSKLDSCGVSDQCHLTP